MSNGLPQPEGSPPANVLPFRPGDHAEAAEPPPGLPRRAMAYVLVTFALGAGSVALFAPTLDTEDLPAFLVFAALAIAFGRTRIPIYGDTTVSITMVGDFAIAFLWGPAGAVIVSPISSLVTDYGGGGAWYKRLFNVGSGNLVNLGVASLIWLTVGADLQPSWALVPVALAAVAVYYLLNTSLVTLAVSLSTRTPVLEVWREKFEWLLAHYVVFGVLGLALAVAYDGMGMVGLLAFLLPPLMMRFTLKQYLDKTKANVEELNKRNRELQKANREITGLAEHLRETYDGTLEALVSALDARDRETKGHSLRVAKYMMEIAYFMNVEPGTTEWVDMQRGALLHDVGKIGVSDTILHKPGPLTEDEWVDMRRHPKIGHDMLREISFLSGAAGIVMAHHERWDGKGYPLGLQGEEIPLGARVFVLADTFDAMTSDRPYRAAMTSEAAREEIIKCSGTQFDPRCVQAFLMAFDKVVEIRFTEHEEPTEHHAAAAPRRAA